MIYGTWELELTMVQDFPNICHKRQYISVGLNVRVLLEKQDRNVFRKITQFSTHPLREQVPKTKVIHYNLRYLNGARTLINTERFKNTKMQMQSSQVTLHYIS